jgi:hypothetical protein
MCSNIRGAGMSFKLRWHSLQCGCTQCTTTGFRSHTTDSDGIRWKTMYSDMLSPPSVCIYFLAQYPLSAAAWIELSGLYCNSLDFVNDANKW